MNKKSFTPQAFHEGEMPHIEMKPVKSSQIKSIGHCDKTNTLAVVFNHGAGAIYHYPDFSRDEFEKFSSADSIGTHFGKHVKHLAFKKFRPPAQTKKAA